MFYIVCHYDEIGLKGNNRGDFENKLISNIQEKMETRGLQGEVKRIFGRIVIKTQGEEKNIWEEILKHTFGMVNFSFAQKINPEINNIIEEVIKMIGDTNSGKTFRISSSRSNKNYPLNSQEINRKVGEAVFNKLNLKVNLEDPDLNCFIEIVNKDAYIFINKFAGPGGLPVGSSGRAIVLLSGGIDSPVAAWYANKRGLATDFIHFHSYPHTTKASIEKVKKLFEVLKNYGSANSKLYLFPFVDLQKKILTRAPEKYRIILYRRFMLRLAEELAKKNKAKVLITGESLGQVASQTIENISVVEEAANILILRPLIGFDKKEIINQARQIGTYDISILPHEDCCIVFMPRHPETRGKINDVLEIEKELEIDIKKENLNFSEK
jgi:thiamine biosynthesis protein ThiI